MPIHFTDSSFSSPSRLVAWSEFLELTGARAERVSELVELGWLQPLRQEEQTFLFRQVDVYKTRKVDRLCDDFDLSSLAGSIIVDLLERIEELETRLRER
jgi:chaperone modulatory protein CbpM